MNNKKFSCGISGVALAAVLLGACSSPVPPAEPPRPVSTFVVDAGSADSLRSYSGEVRARHETPLGFRIGGKLQRRLVDVGAVVKVSQPLAALDPADVALQAAQAEAQRAQAESELKRYRDLRAKNFISQSALDARETAFKAAQAQAGLTRNAQDYATLRADANGVIAATLAEPGQVVAPGTPIVVLAHSGEREVSISIPESAIGLHQVGDAAEVSLWAVEGKTYPAKIREIAPVADPVTRTYPVRVTMQTGERAPALGMTATVSFKSKQSDSLLIPAAAIYQQGEQPAVWLIDEQGVTSLRPIKVTAWRDSGAMVTAGLKPGDRIVASGVHKVHAGEKVNFASAVR